MDFTKIETASSNNRPLEQELLTIKAYIGFLFRGYLDLVFSKDGRSLLTGSIIEVDGKAAFITSEQKSEIILKLFDNDTKNDWGIGQRVLLIAGFNGSIEKLKVYYAPTDSQSYMLNNIKRGYYTEDNFRVIASATISEDDTFTDISILSNPTNMNNFQTSRFGT